MNSRSPNAFLLSAILHGLVVALILFLSYSFKENSEESPKIFELVAGAGDNYGATEAPALGSPTGIKVDFPEVAVATPAPAPTPEPEPAPIEPAPPEPSPVVAPEPAPTPTPVPPTKVVKPKPVPKPVDTSKMAKAVTRITEKRAANIKKKIDKEKKEAEDRAAKEAALDAKRMTKAEFDRLNHSTPSTKSGSVKVSKIDTAGIAGGVTGGSTSNKTGGAGGKALTREQMELSDAYIAILIQRLHDAHQKPDGLSDLLQTKVSFRLNADGSISDVRITRSSGNNDYDNSVLAAFRKVRLPTPPANLKTDVYSVTFKMKEDE